MNRGFTLIELIFVIILISLAAATIAAPLLVAVSGVGAGGGAVKSQLAALASGQAETVTKQLTGLTQTQWTQTLQNLVASSLPDKTLDGRTFRITTSYICLKSDLATQDAACADGFARITVTVTESAGGGSFTIPFIKTRTGI